MVKQLGNWEREVLLYIKDHDFGVVHVDGKHLKTVKLIPFLEDTKKNVKDYLGKLFEDTLVNVEAQYD
jgi:hypothetical protein